MFWIDSYRFPIGFALRELFLSMESTPRPERPAPILPLSF